MYKAQQELFISHFERLNCQITDIRIMYKVIKIYTVHSLLMRRPSDGSGAAILASEDFVLREFII